VLPPARGRQQALYFFPLPQGQGSLRPTFMKFLQDFFGVETLKPLPEFFLHIASDEIKTKLPKNSVDRRNGFQ
jgi:hypothetical protein